MALSSNKCAILLRMISVSFIHFTDTERNITRRYPVCCYKKDTDHLCSDNIGINLCDVGENFNNTEKHTINLQLEYQYRSNSKLSIRETVWKIPEKKRLKKQP